MKPGLVPGFLFLHRASNNFGLRQNPLIEALV
jgi:hypothetical protein